MQYLNSLAPGRSGFNFKSAIFNLVLLIGIFTSSKDNALRWMPRDLTNDKSTLVQAIAWYHQATSHHLSQCWLSSMSPYGVTRPQWVNSLRPSDAIIHLASQSTLVQVMTCCLLDTKPLPEPTLIYFQLNLKEQTSGKFESKYKNFHTRNCFWKCHLQDICHFVQASICWAINTNMKFEIFSFQRIFGSYWLCTWSCYIGPCYKYILSI